MTTILNTLVYAAGSAVVGVLFFAIALMLAPKLINRITPHIDEEKEILKGNVAVAVYFGLLVGAACVGLSIIIAAAILSGFHGI